MAKGRKNGCPVNIRNWLIYIQDKSDDSWVRIYGLNSMTASYDSETEEGSQTTDLWSEPYITKRSGSISLEGKQVIVESTGLNDAGQELLNSYGDLGGCDADLTLRFVDPYGHCWEADYILTGKEISADETEINVSWDLELVGEVDVKEYKQMSSIALKQGENSASELSLTVAGGPKIITIVFTPTDASNKRFKVTNSAKAVCSIGAITDTGFTITPIAAGSASITVTTINGAKTATCALTVTAS